ncbi:hypothetical protein AB0L00_18325 [Actinoallomurus sp. NPDC052308]|uniref:hypothetical protein n=1 Tax=Actinoallomurus sp. NPDC052308 TaxID=3155530 RepID=UPI00341B812F
MTGKVVQVDLRGRSADGAAELTRGLLTGEDHTDLTRLLVIDDTAALNAHRAAYESLLVSRYTERLLCVAVGRTDADPPRIELPGVLTQTAGVLWVPDPAGINWRLSAASATRRDRAEGTDTGLTRLVEVLNLDDVFQRTVELIDKVPGRVANPGLRLAGVGGGRAEFLQALLAAGERALASGTGRVPDLPESTGRAPGPRNVRLRGGGAVQQSADRTREAVAEARGLADELTEPGALFAGPVPVEQAMATAGERLGLLRASLEELFTAAHGTTGLGPAQQQAIDRAGVVLPEPEDFDAAKTRKVVDTYLDDGLRQRTPLPQLVAGLDTRMAGLLPRGSRERIPALRRACPDELPAGLREPAPMPGPEPWLPVVGLLTAALAGLTPFGPVSGLVMAVLWTLLVTLTVLRGPGGRSEGTTGALAANGVASTVGGVGVGLVAPSPAPVVWAPAVVVGLVVAGWAVIRSWRSRTSAWIAESGIDAAGEAVDDLLSVVSAAALEWSQTDARVATADAVGRMTVALDHVAEEIQAQVERARIEAPGPLRPDPRIEHYLADLVRAAMAPRLRGLAADSADRHGEEARRTAAERFAAWHEHVAEHGPLAAPPFATEPPPETSGTPRDELPDLAVAVAYDPGSVMWQLCAADDLSVLDPGSTPPPVVRFAPRHGRTAGSDALPPDTVWVTSARHAGLLRLVPVRPGLTAQRW